MFDFVTRAFTYPPGYDYHFELVAGLLLLIYLVDSLFITKLWQYREDDFTDEEMAVASRYYYFSIAASVTGLFVSFPAVICAWVVSFLFDMCLCQTGGPPEEDLES